MNEQRDKFCKAIKEKYPDISMKADAEYLKQWDDYYDPEYYSYSWFEALANALNKQMYWFVPAEKFKSLFSDISEAFEAGDENIKKCIDVAFVENLYWQVAPEKAEAYWNLMPEKLKALYVNFHNRTPLQ